MPVSLYRYCFKLKRSYVNIISCLFLSSNFTAFSREKLSLWHPCNAAYMTLYGRVVIRPWPSGDRKFILETKLVIKTYFKKLTHRIVNLFYFVCNNKQLSDFSVKQVKRSVGLMKITFQVAIGSKRHWKSTRRLQFEVEFR